MNVLIGTNIDLITPFPLQEVKRVIGWMYCYKSHIIDDSMPTDNESILNIITAQLQSPNILSWGLIDKNNTIHSKHEAPLVGMVTFEYQYSWNGYFHIVTSRKSWGLGFSDEAGKMVIDTLFQTNPELQRVSAAILDRNADAKALAKRVGLQFEGVFPDFTRQKGKPLGVVHFGLTRTKWEESNAISRSSASSVDINR